jgi:hypothetical protein
MMLRALNFIEGSFFMNVNCTHQKKWNDYIFRVDKFSFSRLEIL